MLFLAWAQWVVVWVLYLTKKDKCIWILFQEQWTWLVQPKELSQTEKSVKAHAKQADIIDGYLSTIKSKSPAMKKVKAKGGGTKKVCLPLAKIRSMSSAEKSRIISAKRKAGAAGKYKRSSKSNTTGTSSGGDLKTWVKQDWRQVANPSKKCGEK